MFSSDFGTGGKDVLEGTFVLLDVVPDHSLFCCDFFEGFKVDAA